MWNFLFSSSARRTTLFRVALDNDDDVKLYRVHDQVTISTVAATGKFRAGAVDTIVNASNASVSSYISCFDA